MESTKVQTTTSRALDAPLIVLLFVALLVRGGALFVSLSSFNDDPDDYGRLAENWYAYGTFGTGSQATAFRPPLYPWTLKNLIPLQKPAERTLLLEKRGSESSEPSDSKSKFKSRAISFVNERLTLSRNASIALFHWILGLATVALVYKLARYASLSPRLAACAGLLVALDPILLQQSRLVMTETLAAFFSAASLLAICFCMKRQRARFSAIAFFLLGILFGLSTLCRPAFFAFVGLVFLGLVVFEARNPKLGAFLRLGAFLVGIGCVSGPWLLRNIREFNKPILTTTHGGYTLYLANNPEIYKFYKNSPAWSLWSPEEFHARRAVEYKEALEAAQIRPNSKQAELFQDRWTKQEAQKTIAGDPQTFLYACGLRFGELWRVLPQDAVSIKSTKANNRVDRSRNLTNYARTGVAIFYSWEFFFAALALLVLIAATVKRIKQTRSQSSSETLDAQKPSTPIKESPIVWGLLLVLSVQIPHLVYWTNMRMRAPLETFIPILTIIGIVVIYRFIIKNRTLSNNSNIQKEEQTISEKNE